MSTTEPALHPSSGKPPRLEDFVRAAIIDQRELCELSLAKPVDRAALLVLYRRMNENTIAFGRFCRG